MSLAHLGATFDLHGGGIDLCFPHHENEIAQSECATGVKGFAAHWFHSAHLMVEGEKMSKSKGNLYTLDELVAKGFTPMEVRATLISGHYRSSLNFTMKGVEDSRSALAKLERGTDRLLAAAGFTRAEFAAPVAQEVQTSWGRFAKAWEVLQDDLNIPGCLGQVFTVLAEKDEPSAEQARQDISGLAKILFALGFELFVAKAEVAVPADVADLGARRWAAKQSKDFAAADQLRKDLAAHVATDIGKFARPGLLLFAPDLPKTRSGKIMRRLLKNIAEGKELGDATTLRDPSILLAIKEDADRQLGR
jgi:cysteinyl-tRNA synthetase